MSRSRPSLFGLFDFRINVGTPGLGDDSLVKLTYDSVPADTKG